MISLERQVEWFGRVQVVLAVATVLALGAFYFFVYRAETSRIEELRAQTLTTEVQIRRNEEAARDLEAIKRDVVRLRDQITRSRKLPKQQDLPAFLRDIEQLSQASRLQKFRCEPESKKKLDLCDEMPISLNFGGSFMDVASFLRQAEELPRMTRTRKLSLRCRDGKSGIVDAQLSVSIFYSDGQ